MVNYFTCSAMIYRTWIEQMLTILMALSVEHLINLPAEITNILKNKVYEWMNSQALFIQALFGNLSWES